MKEYYTIADIIRIDTIQSIQKALLKFGVTETKEKIYKYYGNNKKALSYMLECYEAIIGGQAWDFLT